MDAGKSAFGGNRVEIGDWGFWKARSDIDESTYMPCKRVKSASLPRDSIDDDTEEIGE